MNEQKSRILFFLPLPPPVTGAGLRNLSLVQSRLLNGSFNIRVIPFNFAGEVDDIGKFSLKKIGKLIARTLTIVKSLILFRPHLVYFNFSLYGVALYRDFFFVLIYKIFRKKILFHLRTQGVRKQIENSRTKRALFTFVFKNSSVVCLSNFLSKDIEEVYSGTPFIVNNGIEDLSARYPPILRSDSSMVQLLYIGHLWEFKGINELILAAKQVKESGISFKLIIAGPEGDLTFEELNERLKELDLEEYVKIVGPKSGDEKYHLFRTSDVFVMPTKFDAFPGALLEAMQFSLPVISTFEGAVPEIVDDGITGYLVPKGDVESLAQKMKLLIGDVECCQFLGKKGREKFEAIYQVDCFEVNMKKTFAEVLSLK